MVSKRKWKGGVRVWTLRKHNFPMDMHHSYNVDIQSKKPSWFFDFVIASAEPEKIISGRYTWIQTASRNCGCKIFHLSWLLGYLKDIFKFLWMIIFTDRMRNSSATESLSGTNTCWIWDLPQRASRHAVIICTFISGLETAQRHRGMLRYTLAVQHSLKIRTTERHNSRADKHKPPSKKITEEVQKKQAGWRWRYILWIL